MRDSTRWGGSLRNESSGVREDRIRRAPSSSDSTNELEDSVPISVYDVLDEWKLLRPESNLTEYTLGDWRNIDRALTEIYEKGVDGRLGSSFLGANLTTRIAEGIAAPEAIATSVLAFDAVWLFDPIYSLISQAASDAWTLLPERNSKYFGQDPHIYIDWRPLGHQGKDDRRAFLLREIPLRLQRLRELRPLFETGAICFISWERLLLKNRERLKAAIDSLRASAEKVVTKHPQNSYNLGFRLSPIRVQLSSDVPQFGFKKGADLHIVDRAPVLLYGLMNTLISAQSGSVLIPELLGDSDLYEFIMSGLNPIPPRVKLNDRIELPRFSHAIWDDLVAIRKDSEALATLREVIRLAASSEEGAILTDVRGRLEGAADKIRAEGGLSKYFKAGTARFGLESVKGITAGSSGAAAAGMITGGAVGGLPGAVIGAAVGGVGGAAAGFFLDLATRAFDKDRKAKKTRAELFVRIAQKLGDPADS
jgi:hypothetical protein